MGKKITENIKLASYEDLFKSTQSDEDILQTLEINIDKLYTFTNHPYKVLDDEKMDELVDSIKENGILVPGIARKRKEGGYEIISGHRRKRACEIAGIDKMPFIIKNVTDEEASIMMVDANIQRENLLVSEKAKAYAMKYQAEKSQGKASGLMLQKMSEEFNESMKQIQRYVWISRLLPELLDYVDEHKLGFTQGVDISFLNEEQQAWILLVIKIGGVNISIKQSAEIKRLALENPTLFSFDMVQEILTKKDTYQRKFALNEKKLSKYFDKTYTNEKIEELIISLLDQWKEGNDGGSEK